MNIVPNLRKIGPAFLLIISFSAGVQAQVVKWPVTYYTHKGPLRIIHPDVRQGYIVTTSADTVRGFIKLFPNTDFFFGVLDTATKMIRNVDIPAIVLIRAYDGKIEGSFSDYYNLPYQNSMWLLLARKNDISIYRRELDGSPARIILVTPDDKRIKILSGRGNLFRNNDLDAPLFHFIKKRYKIQVKPHFASTQDIYNYILEKENERIDGIRGRQG
jgi:hypothetical protein